VTVGSSPVREVHASAKRLTVGSFAVTPAASRTSARIASVNTVSASPDSGSAMTGLRGGV